MPTYRDQAIILSVKPVRDADRHYVAYTEHHGKVKLLAKGTRRGRSKMSPHLGGFGVAEIMVARGRIMDRLAGASLVRPFPGLMADLSRTLTAQAFYLIIDALTKRELPDQRIFGLLAGFLEALEGAAAASPRPVVYDAAALKLLDLLGFGPELGACVRCRRPLEPGMQSLEPLGGGLECAACRGPGSSAFSVEAVKALRFWRAEPLESAARLRLDARVRRETVRAVDLLLGVHHDDRSPAMVLVREAA